MKYTREIVNRILNECIFIRIAKNKRKSNKVKTYLGQGSNLDHWFRYWFTISQAYFIVLIIISIFIDIGLISIVCRWGVVQEIITLCAAVAALPNM